MTSKNTNNTSDQTQQSEDHLFSVLEDLILLMLNPESGYFYHVSGWDLNCAAIGAILAELSLLRYIDTDLEKLILLKNSATGDPILDSVLANLADSDEPRTTVYWIERLSADAEAYIDQTLQKLVDEGHLNHHDGEFWTPNFANDHMLTMKMSINKIFFEDSIPLPRESIIVSLVNTCDIWQFMYEMSDELQQRITLVSNLDLIGRSIAQAVKVTITSPLFRHSTLTRKPPIIGISNLLLNRNLRKGRLPIAFAELAAQHGPVFQVNPPFKKPMVFLVGPQINRWAHRNGRLVFRTRDYFSDLEQLYGAAGLLPALSGVDHFRLRKAMQPGYSRKRIGERLDDLATHFRNFCANWETGTVLPGVKTTRNMINSQISPVVLSIDSQDIIEDLITFKERALITHVAKVLPKFLLYTSRMKSASKAVNVAVDRIQTSHTPHQRRGCPVDLADDLLSLHQSDPQFLPESNMKFSLSAPMLASMYVGDMFAFSLYALASQPQLAARVSQEADALFINGVPKLDELNESATDVTTRFMYEVLRLYPTIPMSLRTVMNTCVIEGFEIPAGQDVFIVQTASHYMEEAFPDPLKFDIDRYLPERKEHRQLAYAPYGWGTHRCLGYRMMELLLTFNLLSVAHHFRLELDPVDYKLGYNPLPSMSPDKKLKYRIAQIRHPVVNN